MDDNKKQQLIQVFTNFAEEIVSVDAREELTQDMKDTLVMVAYIHLGANLREVVSLEEQLDNAEELRELLHSVLAKYDIEVVEDSGIEGGFSDVVQDALGSDPYDDERPSGS